MSAFLTDTQALLLGRVASMGEAYGYQLVKSSDGALKLGTVYVLMGRLEKAGLVNSQREPTPTENRPARRVYKITEAGRKVHAAYTAAAEAYAQALN